MSYSHTQNRGMSADALKAILARNVNKLIDRDTPPSQRRSVRAWALARELEVRQIDRVVKGRNVTLETLYQIADATHLQPWQLLLEDFDPAAPPDAPISEADKLMLARLRRLLGDA